MNLVSASNWGLLFCSYAPLSWSITRTRSKRPISGNLVFTAATRAANTSVNSGYLCHFSLRTGMVWSDKGCSGTSVHKRAEERALMDLHYAIMLKKNDLLTTQEEEEVKNTKATARDGVRVEWQLEMTG
ncbi:hypothetical protein SEVIR_1G167666v4 [Setaria viridis]